MQGSQCWCCCCCITMQELSYDWAVMQFSRGHCPAYEGGGHGGFHWWVFSCPFSFPSFAGRFLLAESCVQDCPQGTFGNARMRKCEKCSDGCEQCTRINHCLKCLPDSKKHHYLLSGRCLQACPRYVSRKSPLCRCPAHYSGTWVPFSLLHSP